MQIQFLIYNPNKRLDLNTQIQIFLPNPSIQTHGKGSHFSHFSYTQMSFFETKSLFRIEYGSLKSVFNSLIVLLKKLVYLVNFIKISLNNLKYMKLHLKKIKKKNQIEAFLEKLTKIILHFLKVIIINFKSVLGACLPNNKHLFDNRVLLKTLLPSAILNMSNNHHLKIKRNQH